MRSSPGLERGRGTTPQHDIPAVSERPLRYGRLGIEARYEPLAAGLIRDRLQDRIPHHQRVAREIHLRRQSTSEQVAEEREMDVRRSPRVAMILPRIGAGLDRDEAIAALRVSQAAAGSAEVGVQWCGVLVILVKVAAGGIGLPDLNHRARYRSAITVEQPTRDNNALDNRLARVLAGQVVVQLRKRPGG